MHVADAGPRLARDLKRVSASKGDMPGVEAEGVRSGLEKSLDVLRPLDRRTPVRMHGDGEAVRASDLPSVIDALEELAPSVARELLRTGITGARQSWREDHELRATRGQPFRL